jgi:hypothetical protein
MERAHVKRPPPQQIHQTTTRIARLAYLLHINKCADQEAPSGPIEATSAESSNKLNYSQQDRNEDPHQE